MNAARVLARDDFLPRRSARGAAHTWWRLSWGATGRGRPLPLPAHLLCVTVVDATLDPALFRVEILLYHAKNKSCCAPTARKVEKGRVRARCAVRTRRGAGAARIALRPEVPRGRASRESLMSLAVFFLGQAHLARAARRGGTSAGATRHCTHARRGFSRCRMRGPATRAHRWRDVCARCAGWRRAALGRHSVIGWHRVGGPAQPQ